MVRRTDTIRRNWFRGASGPRTANVPGSVASIDESHYERLINTMKQPCTARLASSIVLCLASAALGACNPPPPLPKPPPPPKATAAAAPAPKLDQVPRQEFNRLAAELDLPLFWRADDDGDGALSAGEVALLWGIDDSLASDWIADGKLSGRFYEAYVRIARLKSEGPREDALSVAERERRELVRKELGHGRPTLVLNDLAGDSDQDRLVVQKILEAARLVERIYAKQRGSFELGEKLLSDDSASRMLFYRNQGPWCEAPQTEKEPHCNALPWYPSKISGLYPLTMQGKEGFCEDLKKEPNAEKLRHQFHVVREADGKLVAVPYHQAYAEEMKAISGKLREAAAAITSADEAALQKYLEAAAQAFLDDSWETADEAWAAMNAKNSKWYLRIGPDEVYFEPCSLKAGFHVSFARINQDSLAWQAKLDPVKGDMEKALAKLAGNPYKARDVSFQLPDFIDIVLNAGDSRNAHGATIGQSLPNWGPVANEGRGRTVAMTNLYTDPDSLETMTQQASAMFCAATMTKFDTGQDSFIMGTVLHEAAHNLGPAHEYQVKGKKDREIFDGPMASMMEELKAQTAALYFTDWLVDRKLLSREAADKAHVRDISWAFGHISRGMYDAEGRPKPYSQLAAVQLGYLIDKGAIEWRAADKTANGSETGCLELKLDKFPAVVETLMKDVAGIKARGDKRGAEKLKKAYVDVDGERKKLMDTITERWLRAPKASFVYAVKP